MFSGVAVQLKSLKVWAPQAERVSVECGGQVWQLKADSSGCWTSDPEVLPPGTDYWIRINDGERRPDPRSPWQPAGVHGASRWLDHAEYQWNDKGFQAPPLSSAIIYELHIGTFTREGTFEAAIEKLQYLIDLGITHVELMPVASFPGSFGWGYDGVALFAPQEAYGGPTALKRLIDACHQHGLAVILDVVYNHVGPSGNYLGEFGPYFSPRHSTPWGPAINFDGPYSDGVRRFFCDNALMWLRDYHFDALRLDAIHAIVDTGAVHFLEQLAIEVDQLSAHTGRQLSLIAESDLNDPRVVRSIDAGGYGIDAQWCDDFHHALHIALSGERSGYYEDFGSLETLAVAFEQPYVYADKYSTFRKRRHGRPAVGLTAHRFVSYSQNHDQIGNRALGDRLNHLIGIKRAKIGAGLALLGPYIPQLFQGEEWASNAPFPYFADWNDEPSLADAVRKGRCEEFAAFGWKPEQLLDPVSSKTFARAKLDWDALAEEEHAEMLAWYQQLIRLRKTIPDLTDGRPEQIETRFCEQEEWLVVVRGSVVLAANFSQVSREVALPDGSALQSVLLASQPVKTTEAGAIRLAPESFVVGSASAL